MDYYSYLKRHTVWNEKSTKERAKCRITLYGWCLACGLCQFIRLQCTLIQPLHWSRALCSDCNNKSFFNLIRNWSSFPEQKDIYRTSRFRLYFWLKFLILLACNHSWSNQSYRNIWHQNKIDCFINWTNIHSKKTYKNS